MAVTNLLVNTLVHLAAFAMIAGVLLVSAPVTHKRAWIKYVLVALEVAIGASMTGAAVAK